MNNLDRFRDISSKIHFMRSNKVTIVSVEEEKVVLRMAIQPEARNPYGVVQGGVLYTLADHAAGMAAGLDERYYVTQNGSLNFLKNQSDGCIFATAMVRHRGKQTCLIAIDIVGDNNQLLATGEFTFFCIRHAEINL